MIIVGLKKKHIILSLIIILLLFATVHFELIKNITCIIFPKTTFSIIMYHQISPKQKSLGEFTLSVNQFEKDLLYIKDNGYTTITITQLIEHVYNDTELPEKPIMLTFDDGYESFYAYVYPLLEKYKMYGVLSIVGSFSDLYTENEDHNLDYSHLNWQEIAKLNESKYIEIQNHTYDMHKLNGDRKGCHIKPNESIEQYKKALNDDIGKLQKDIYEKLDWKPNTFTYPYGYICKESISILKDMGFKAALTCTEKPNTIEYNSNWLFTLGRYNRANGKTSEQFFKKILADTKNVDKK